MNFAKSEQAMHYPNEMTNLLIILNNGNVLMMQSQHRYENGPTVIIIITIMVLKSVSALKDVIGDPQQNVQRYT